MEDKKKKKEDKKKRETSQKVPEQKIKDSNLGSSSPSPPNSSSSLCVAALSSSSTTTSTYANSTWGAGSGSQSSSQGCGTVIVDGTDLEDWPSILGGAKLSSDGAGERVQEPDCPGNNNSSASWSERNIQQKGGAAVGGGAGNMDNPSPSRSSPLSPSSSLNECVQSSDVWGSSASSQVEAGLGSAAFYNSKVSHLRPGPQESPVGGSSSVPGANFNPNMNPSAWPALVQGGTSTSASDSLPLHSSITSASSFSASTTLITTHSLSSVNQAGLHQQHTEIAVVARRGEPQQHLGNPGLELGSVGGVRGGAGPNQGGDDERDCVVASVEEERCGNLSGSSSSSLAASSWKSMPPVSSDLSTDASQADGWGGGGTGAQVQAGNVWGFGSQGEKAGWGRGNDGGSNTPVVSQGAWEGGSSEAEWGGKMGGVSSSNLAIGRGGEGSSSNSSSSGGSIGGAVLQDSASPKLETMTKAWDNQKGVESGDGSAWEWGGGGGQGGGTGGGGPSSSSGGTSLAGSGGGGSGSSQKQDRSSPVCHQTSNAEVALASMLNRSDLDPRVLSNTGWGQTQIRQNVAWDLDTTAAAAAAAGRGNRNERSTSSSSAFSSATMNTTTSRGPGYPSNTSSITNDPSGSKTTSHNSGLAPLKDGWDGGATQSTCGTRVPSSTVRKPGLPEEDMKGTKPMESWGGKGEGSVAASRHPSWDEEDDGGGGVWNSTGPQGNSSSFNSGGWGQTHGGKRSNIKGGGGDSWMNPVSRQFSNMGLLGDDPSDDKKIEGDKRGTDYNGEMRRGARGGGGYRMPSSKDMGPVEMGPYGEKVPGPMLKQMPSPSGSVGGVVGGVGGVGSVGGVGGGVFPPQLSPQQLAMLSNIYPHMQQFHLLARIMAILQQQRQHQQGGVGGAAVGGGSSKLSPSHLGVGHSKLPMVDALPHPGMGGPLSDLHAKTQGMYSGLAPGGNLSGLELGPMMGGMKDTGGQQSRFKWMMEGHSPAPSPPDSTLHKNGSAMKVRGGSPYSQYEMLGGDGLGIPSQSSADNWHRTPGSKMGNKPATSSWPPEFQPGVPWKGIQSSGDPESDPYMTPGSVLGSPGPQSLNDSDHQLLRDNIGPNPSLNTSLPSPGAWPYSASDSPLSNAHSTGKYSEYKPSWPPEPIGQNKFWKTNRNSSQLPRPPPGLTNQKQASPSPWGSGGPRLARSWGGGGMNQESRYGPGSAWSDGVASRGSCWLLLSNLTPQIDGSTLRTICMQHGPLLTFHLGLTQGSALIRYSSRQEAAKAQGALHMCVLGNTTILAEFVSEEEVARYFAHSQAGGAEGASSGGAPASGMQGSSGTGTAVANSGGSSPGGSAADARARELGGYERRQNPLPSSSARAPVRLTTAGSQSTPKQLSDEPSIGAHLPAFKKRSLTRDVPCPRSIAARSRPHGHVQCDRVIPLAPHRTQAFFDTSSDVLLPSCYRTCLCKALP
ncbi:hypothetical protein F2P81_014708 [Scophthalmus maximus]|uniref:TNRC6 PABC binding domain-containing protein n=1 Tax=Scophthalmus maximus TaxID=52904 RepID=A0A6A4SJT2_SCOMX|nr:hypothetical protein F2P81_014708 [Scophthalmus maximus]